MNGDESVLLDIIKEKDVIENFFFFVEELVGFLNCENSMFTLFFEQEVECLEDVRFFLEKSIQLVFVNFVIFFISYQCTVCQFEYNNLYGFFIYYGKKYLGMKVKVVDFVQDIDINLGVVYKCRYCSYINIRIYGVLIYYQKRYSFIKVIVEDFVYDVE